MGDKKYKKSDTLQQLMNEVIDENSIFLKLKNARIACVEGNKPKTVRGKIVYADCTKLQDKIKAVAGYDFVITFYADALVLDAEHLKRVMYHELLHVGYEPESGACSIVPHDLEDFRLVIDRWGTDWVREA